MAENLVEKAIREAEEACQLAIASTPQQYRGFITLISQSKKIGRGQNASYANIRLPYMAVDGRVKQAMDEHREANARLTIDTIFEQLGDKTICRAIVNSTLLGSAVGYAEVKIGGSGVDSTNPLENGQTSAIGRALGFLGYGLFGTGIASAEEVLAAMSEQTRQRAEDIQNTNTQVTETKDDTKQEPATEKQLGLIYGLLKQHGIQDGDKRELIEFAHPDGLSKALATRIIEHVNSEDTLPGYLRKLYIKMLVKRHGHDRQKVAEHMDTTFHTHDPEKLSPGQFAMLVTSLIPGQEEEPDDIYLPGEVVKDVTVQEWLNLNKELFDNHQIAAGKLQEWALAEFGNGTAKLINELPKEVYYSLKAMGNENIASKVREYHAVDSEQGVLVG